MMTLGGVSKRVKAIYERFYADREAQRFSNLYAIFDRLAANVEAGASQVRLEIDYLALAEMVRSYFLENTTLIQRATKSRVAGSNNSSKKPA
jgi:hypothetical protein